MVFLRVKGQICIFVFLSTKIEHAGIIKLLPQWRETMISDQALQEFKKIWQEETGQDISDKEALDAAVALLGVFDAIYRPIPKEWSDEYDKHNQNHGTE